MKNTKNYVIFRNGSNGANQPMCNRTAVALVEAFSGPEALEKAKIEEPIRVHCYNNQHLSWRPAAHTKKEEIAAIEELYALEAWKE